MKVNEKIFNLGRNIEYNSILGRLYERSFEELEHPIDDCNGNFICQETIKDDVRVLDRKFLSQIYEKSNHIVLYDNNDIIKFIINKKTDLLELNNRKIILVGHYDVLKEMGLKDHDNFVIGECEDYYDDTIYTTHSRAYSMVISSHNVTILAHDLNEYKDKFFTFEVKYQDENGIHYYYEKEVGNALEISILNTYRFYVFDLKNKKMKINSFPKYVSHFRAFIYFFKDEDDIWNNEVFEHELFSTIFESEMWDKTSIDGEFLASEYFGDIDINQDLEDIFNKLEKNKIFVEVVGEIYYDEWEDYFGEVDSNIWIETYHYREIKLELFLKHFKGNKK